MGLRNGRTIAMPTRRLIKLPTGRRYVIGSPRMAPSTTGLIALPRFAPRTRASAAVGVMKWDLSLLGWGIRYRWRSLVFGSFHKRPDGRHQVRWMKVLRALRFDAAAGSRWSLGTKLITRSLPGN